MTIVVSSRRKTRGKSEKQYRTITGFLRDLTSSLDFGLKSKAGNPYHVNKNKEVVGHINYGFAINRVKLLNFTRHFTGLSTLYFAGNSHTKAKYTLLMIDVDCHGRGTVAGAIKFCQYLRDTLFAGLYFEASGRGAHAYLIVDKQRHHPAFLNTLYKRLEGHLKTVLRAGDFDVENVEIKGSFPVIEWAERARGERPKVLSYRAGMLAALPRERDRFAELRATARIDADFMMKLPVVRADEPAVPRFRVLPAVPVPTGSVSGRVISDDEVGRITGRYAELAKSLLGSDGLKLSGRAMVTEADVAVFLCLLKYFTNNPNPEGTLPWQRFKGLWEALYEADHVDRQFNPRRFAAVRDLLDSFGLIEWADRTYQLGVWEGGKYRKGRAAKWKASARLMSMLDEVKERDTLSSNKSDPVIERFPVEEGEEKDILSSSKPATVTDLSPSEEGEKRDILSSNKEHHLAQKPRQDIIRPIPIYAVGDQHLLVDPGDLVPCYQLAA